MVSCLEAEQSRLVHDMGGATVMLARLAALAFVTNRAVAWVRRNRRLPTGAEFMPLARRAASAIYDGNSDVGRRSQSKLSTLRTFRIPRTVDRYEEWVRRNALNPRSVSALKVRLAEKKDKLPR